MSGKYEHTARSHSTPSNSNKTNQVAKGITGSPHEGISSHGIMQMQKWMGNQAMIHASSQMIQRVSAAGTIGSKQSGAPTSRVIQKGGDERSNEANTEIIKKITKVNDMVVYYTRGKEYYHVEAWENQKKVGVVDIQDGDPTVLLTHSDEQGGRGNVLVTIAIKVIAKYHANGKGNVMLPMGGGAVVKLMISKLSQVFGNPDIHAEAEKLRKARKAKEKKGQSSSSQDLDRFDEQFVEEHMLHMRALTEGEYADQIKLMSPVGMVVKEPDDQAKVPEVDVGDDYLNQLLRAPKLTVTFPNALFRKFANELG
ncbi:hypothetical protein [Marinicrinis sediminis]|uniref:Uncharacterized protein n=1 Tax=Marinicrinis sediminis TaxID=1652465 RepID=A0ABW5RFB4_9BACL